MSTNAEDIRGGTPIPAPPGDVAPVPVADPAVESLRSRYLGGALTEDELRAELRRMAVERARRAAPVAPVAPTAGGDIPFGRFVGALGAFCEAYMTYDEVRRA